MQNLNEYRTVIEKLPIELLEQDRDALLNEQNTLLNRLQFVEKRLDRVMAAIAIHDTPAQPQTAPDTQPRLRLIQGGMA